MPDTQYISGLSDLEKNLQELADVGRDKDSRKILRRATSQGLKVFANEIKATAPRQAEPRSRTSAGAIFGPLFSRIRTSLRFDRSALAVIGKAGPRAKAAFYAHFYEFGTSRQPPRPWLRPIFARKGQAALDKFVSELKDFLERFGR